MSSKGRVYRRCACRDENGKQLGARCPLLLSKDPKHAKHGTWTFAVDVPDLVKKRKTIRRGGFPTKRAAQAELDKVLDRMKRGVRNDDRQTLADYLTKWLEAKRLKLKPTTFASYERYVNLELIPELGVIPLEQLHNDHLQDYIHRLQAAGRGEPTIRRIMATVSSALTSAVKQHRITHNPAQHVEMTPIETAERQPWNVTQGAAFLRHAKDDRLWPLFEVLMNCGLRRGEGLGLRWQDVDLDARLLWVRRTMSDVGGRLVFTSPKTKSSEAGVGLAPRVVEALKLQRARQAVERAQWGEAYEDNDLVFSRENGAPLRPDYVLKRFRALSKEIGLPTIRLHDLRHGAATAMITNGVPLAIVSKTLRHSQIGITHKVYSHLTKEASQHAVDTVGSVFDAADAEDSAEAQMKEALSPDATTLRPQSPKTKPAGPSRWKNPQVISLSRLSESNRRPVHYESEPECPDE